MSTELTSETSQVTAEPRPAPLGARVTARLTDLLLAAGAFFTALWVFRILDGTGLPSALAAIVYVVPVVFVLYNEVHLVATTGTTLGKSVRQLTLTRPDGSNLSTGQALTRLVVSIPVVTGAVMFVRDDRRGAHDLAAGSVVREAEVPDLSRQRSAYAILPFAVFFVALFVWQLGGSSVRFKRGTEYDVAGPETKFDWGFFFEMIPEFLKALWITAKGTLAGFAIAVVLGLFLALARRSEHRLIRWPTALFIEFIRSTPLLIQLFFIFFALPRITWLPEWLRVLNPITALMVGLGIHYATYCSEAYRAGINSVPKGQWEAATAMNLSSFTTWTRVILPQAIPNVLPALGNFLVAGFKDAPLGATIQVTGVLFFADTLSSQVFRSTEAFTLVGIGFLVISVPAAFAIRRLERRVYYERA